MSDISRRDALRRLALAMTATGLIDRVAAEEVHAMAAQAAAAAGGTYAPTFLNGFQRDNQIVQGRRL